jgi:hypothetical protein
MNDEVLTATAPRDEQGHLTVRFGRRMQLPGRDGDWAVFDLDRQRDEILLAPWREGWWYAHGPGMAVHCFTAERSLCMVGLVAEPGKRRSSQGAALKGLCKVCCKIATRHGIPVPDDDWRP